MDWFRMYSEFAADPKVQSLPEVMQRRLVMLFCLRCSNTLGTLLDDELAFALRISADDLTATRALFVQKGFLDGEATGWQLANWDKRQMASDSSAPRVAKHRAKLKAQAEAMARRIGNVTESAQNRTEQNREEGKPLGASAPGELPGFEPPPEVKAKAPRAGKPADADFEKAWAMYPAREGGNPKKEALAAWSARLREGETAEVMLAGLERYKAYVAADGKIGSRYVLQAATFFGPGKRYLEAYAISRGKTGTKALMLVAGNDHSGARAAMNASIAARGGAVDVDVNLG
ncbi:hypothetical protein AB4Z19_15485 [Pseudoduganella sp. RAF19]|uniref:hypothetical protein n=1 Tax=Bacteria TaxID=2 RepID=UPI003F97CC88